MASPSALTKGTLPLTGVTQSMGSSSSPGEQREKQLPAHAFPKMSRGQPQNADSEQIFRAKHVHLRVLGLGF